MSCLIKDRKTVICRFDRFAFNCQADLYAPLRLSRSSKKNIARKTL